MEVVIRFSMIEYLAVAHAITGFFGYTGESASKTEYNVNLIM